MTRARPLPAGVLAPLRPAAAGRSPAARWPVARFVTLALVFVAFPAAASLHHVGSMQQLVLFEASFAAMLALTVPRPRSYAFTFLAALLLLGFWVKFNLHTLLDYPYQEPVGGFDGSARSWDEALSLAACAAIGVSVARVCQLALARRSHPPVRESACAPAWFCERRKLVWLITAVAAVALNLANLAFAFYEIGVDPRLVLPAHGNVLVGWLIKLGLALWIATLVHWEIVLARARPDAVLMAPIAEAAMTSVSALSRGIYLFHVVPYLLVTLGRSPRPLRTVGHRRVATLVALALVAFVLSVGAVSALRLLLYPTDGVAQRSSAGSEPRTPNAVRPPAPDRLDPRRVALAVREVRGLVVERWNGMEGVLAISSHDRLGGDLLRAAATEDPGRGQDSMYQRISGADQVYDQSGGYTFLALPGIVGILGYGGSVVVVLAGMAILTAFVLGIETCFQRFVDHPYVASLAGLAMASELTQANFPYLLATFFVLLLLSLGAIAVVTVRPLQVGAAARLWQRRLR